MKNLKQIKRVYIAGKPYVIHWVDEFVMGSKMGISYSAYQKIYVAGEDRPDESALETFWHEIIHVISEDSGLNLEEHQVQAIGCALCNVFLSNFNVSPKPEILK